MEEINKLKREKEDLSKERKGISDQKNKINEIFEEERAKWTEKISNLTLQNKNELEKFKQNCDKLIEEKEIYEKEMISEKNKIILENEAYIEKISELELQLNDHQKNFHEIRVKTKLIIIIK